MTNVTALKQPIETDLERELAIEGAKIIREATAAYRNKKMSRDLPGYIAKAEADVEHIADQRTAELARIGGEYADWIERENKTLETLTRQIAASTARLADLKAERDERLSEAEAHFEAELSEAKKAALAWEAFASTLATTIPATPKARGVK